jgi:hypothetical protein
MFNNGFELAVEVDGRRIPEFGHKGRTYVEGRRGYRYQLKFRNNRAERVLVVPTVDGLSVVDGAPYHAESPGYVVQAYSAVTISGWRTSLSEVRSFEFSDKSGSYSGKTVGQRNCGIIGAQVYSERRPQPSEVHIHHWYPLTPPPTPSYPSPSWTLRCGDSTAGEYLCQSMAADVTPTGPSGPSCAAGVSSQMADQSAMYCSVQNSPDFNLGTAFGAALHDNVNTVTFEKGICLATFEIYYSDRDGLLKDGIQVDKAPELASFPQAFGGFCKPPL